MNQKRLRELFAEMRGDMRDYFDAQRDALNAQSKMVERAFDVYAELLLKDDGVLGKGDGVDVVVPPGGVGMPCCKEGCEVHVAAPDLFCPEHRGE